MGPGEVNSAKILDALFKEIPNDASILDAGCLNFIQYHTSKRLNLPNHKHYGVDYASPSTNIPPGYVFKRVDLIKEPLPFQDDFFNFVVASHIIEHLVNPIEFFAECLRVCKPGGMVYFEAPSERALFLPGMPFAHDQFHSTSFFDDPTHVFRPWSPQSFYRLSRYFQCDPIKTGYYYSPIIRVFFPLLITYALITRNPKRFENWCWRAVGWASYLVVRKPLDLPGKPSFNYFYPPGRF